jgi:hypothetical protein
MDCWDSVTVGILDCQDFGIVGILELSGFWCRDFGIGILVLELWTVGIIGFLKDHTKMYIVSYTVQLILSLYLQYLLIKQ